MQDDEVRVMTYAEFAAARGVTILSARRTVQRYKWRKTKGNDGLTRISIPLGAIPAEPPVVKEDDGEPGAVLIAWLIEAGKLADQRIERAEARAGAAEAQVAAMREQYLAELREMREWQLRLLAQMQPWWRSVLGRRRQPASPPIGKLLSSST